MALLMELLLLFFTAVGMCECCLRLGGYLCKRHKSKSLRGLVVIARLGDGEDAEYVARCVLAQLADLRTSKGDAAEVLLVDDGLTNTGREVCRILSNDCPRVRLCRPEELQRHLG